MTNLVTDLPKPTLLAKSKAPTLPTSSFAPIADTVQCKQTIQRIKSFKILYDKVAPSMAMYMDPIVRLVCGVINLKKTTNGNDPLF